VSVVPRLKRRVPFAAARRALLLPALLVITGDELSLGTIAERKSLLAVASVNTTLDLADLFATLDLRIRL